MSCYYRSLPWLIPQIILLSPLNGEIIIVSPWVDNVLVQVPGIKHGVWVNTNRQIRMSEFLLILARDFNIRSTLVIRDRDFRFERLIRPLSIAYPEKLVIKEVPFLHAKAIVTESFVITTSANLIATSLYRNVESCSLESNTYNSPRRWLRFELNIII